MALLLRDDFDAPTVRLAAKRSKDGRGISGHDHATGEVIPTPSFQQIRALTDLNSDSSRLFPAFPRQSLGGGRVESSFGFTCLSPLAVSRCELKGAARLSRRPSHP
jgi:hypothetical protein